MALPILNETIKYDLIIPSTKQAITYRPYLVKEEKVLLQAFESNDRKIQMRAMVDIVTACVTEHVNGDTLTTFDIEYIFTRLRAKSVGESSTLELTCGSDDCEARSEYVVDLASLEVQQDKEISNIIKLTDTIELELKYPSYTSFVDNYKENMSESSFGMMMVEECILSVNTPDERITEWTKEEMESFIDSMTSNQFSSVGAFLNNQPVLRQEAEYKCVACGPENKVKLEGLQDFF